MTEFDSFSNDSWFCLSKHSWNHHWWRLGHKKKKRMNLHQVRNTRFATFQPCPLLPPAETCCTWHGSSFASSPGHPGGLLKARPLKRDTKIGRCNSTEEPWITNSLLRTGTVIGLLQCHRKFQIHSQSTRKCFSSGIAFLIDVKLWLFNCSFLIGVFPHPFFSAQKSITHFLVTSKFGVASCVKNCQRSSDLPHLPQPFPGVPRFTSFCKSWPTKLRPELQPNNPSNQKIWKKNCSKTNNSIWFQHISQQLPCKYSTVKKLVHCQNTSFVFKLQKPRYTWSYVAGRALPKSLAHHERSSSLCPESDDEFCFYLGKNHFNKHTKKIWWGQLVLNI